MELSKKREDTCNELFVNMQGVMLTVIMDSVNRAGYRARFYIFYI